MLTLLQSAGAAVFRQTDPVPRWVRLRQMKIESQDAFPRASTASMYFNSPNDFDSPGISFRQLR